MNQNLNHIATIENELKWFASVLEARFQSYFEQSTPQDIPPPLFEFKETSYAQYVTSNELTKDERLLLMLAIAPHVQPNLLDVFFTKNVTFERGFTEFGGYLGKFHGGFLPTGETAAFLIAGDDIRKRLDVYALLDAKHLFVREGVISVGANNPDEPVLSCPIFMQERYVHHFLSNSALSQERTDMFPASKIETHLSWEDLVIDASIRDDIDQIKCWIEHEELLMKDLGLGAKVKPGYKCLFYGPPGTGKTLTACLLGKTTGRDVYRVDLSSIVSKYIGETEKNLSRIFDLAENRKWILFFDEADALFGKRTQTSSSNDRFANQEVSYLLQRVEDFPGIVILASNLKSNIDEAFSRRFQSTVFFGMPDAKNRQAIWSKIFEGPLEPDAEIDIQTLAQDYEISGGAAINVFRYGAIKAVRKGTTKIGKEDLIQGIQKEFQKDGKTI
ncbi:ATP-binding protein [Ekhidna sp.]|uniref:ATP-binding protein n=1 Tax=Ekhidna sp. TaxID=2608089 RepID=UPI00329A2008